MKPRPRYFLFLCGLCLAWFATSGSRAAETTPPAPVSFSAKIAPLRAMPGFFPIYWDEKAGKIWLEIPRFDTDFLYVDSLPAGVGSNDIGLDRGQLGQERVVRFTRSGPRVLLVQQNLAFRAENGSAAEKRAVEDSFAQSVIGGFEVAAEERGRVLVDATDFFLRDAHDVAGTLKQLKQGTYTLDPKRSAFYLPNVKAFPRNTEVEVELTFAGVEPGEWVRDVTPDPKSLSVRERHSFIQLPGPGYTPRVFDPRAGYFARTYADYSMPMGDSLVRRFIIRHRLVKKDPTAERSEAVEPIIYYLDPATPEPVRSALLEGARWWNQAFEAAGFINAFRVEMLPADGDLMDVRYNVIQWVHRYTRGWSYGASVSDPRTGEIIKGHVTLGSLRMRQDYLITEGLLSPYEEGKPTSPEMERLVLARLRQLAAHEVGHTLGLAHNYIASTQGRASVMDYPHPLVTLRPDQTIDLSDAYATGIGEWDKVAINYGYRQFSSGGDDPTALSAIIAGARTRGLTFLTDQDARPLGSAHPLVHLWDNGTNAVDELQRLLEVRAVALAHFGEQTIAMGRPLATIEEALVPIYLLHRYQLEAAAKSIGGQTYTYALRGDGQIPVVAVPAVEQRRALTALLTALSSDRLVLPEPLLNLIPPRPVDFPRHRELFSNRTGGTFDAIAPAEAAANLTFSLLFNVDRAARLVQQHARDKQAPGLSEVLDTIMEATWKVEADASYAGEVQRAVADAGLAQLFMLAANLQAPTQVRAETTLALGELKSWLEGAAPRASSPAQRAHLGFGAQQIAQYFENPKDFAPPPARPVPPGQPIGDDDSLDCWADF